jgi:hypothetical protein
MPCRFVCPAYELLSRKNLSTVCILVGGDSMIATWNKRLAEAVDRLCKTLFSDGRYTMRFHQEAARVTGGFPVYCAMDGFLLLARDGRILLYKTETNETREVSGGENQLLALVAAATTYEEFRELMPVRPAKADSCLACRGTGSIYESICGTCYGTGWLER